MSGLFTERYSEQERRDNLAAAMTGEVFWLGHMLLWRPPMTALVVRLGYHTPNDPFDPDEWAEAICQSWAEHGAKI